MTRTMSLRARLILIILAPLMFISIVLGMLTLKDANERASERFDRSLLSTMLAISRDTALSGGDALSAKTLALLRDTSGGPVFYHVYAPNGAYVTGYATPPVLPNLMALPEQNQSYYDAVYQRRPVRALRYVDKMSIGGLGGDFTFTVWQDTALRDKFVRDTTQRIFGLIAIIMTALTLIVWFGVRIGLRPLLDLQDAISQRSPRELNEIRRPVPIEVSGVVRTLNALLAELRTTLTAKDEFISNAAHQLRNPIAGVLAMAEAVRSAKTISDVKERGDELVRAAKGASDLANSLLAFERAISPKPITDFHMIDLNSTISQIATQTKLRADRVGANLIFTLGDFDSSLCADPVLVQQAVLNLIDNALLHGGEKLSQITVTTVLVEEAIHVIVADNGRGIPEDQIGKAMARFGQVGQSEGSGLGLPIAIAVAQNLGGDLHLSSSRKGLTATIILPTVKR